MADLLLESGDTLLLENGDALLLEALSVAVDTSFVHAFIDGADTRLAVRSDSRATLDLVSLATMRCDSRAVLVHSTQATVRE